MAASLPYHEPGIEDILVLSSLLLALNLINSALDRTLYCGLVGQVLIGVAWGTPGAKWLSSSLEDAIVQLGYLGLIMIVFEGMFTSLFLSSKFSGTCFHWMGLHEDILTLKKQAASPPPSRP